MWRIIVISLLGLVAGAPLVQEPTSCDVCQLLVGELQDLLTTSQSQSDIKSYAKDICTKLPGVEKDICLTFTQEFATPLFSKLNSDLSPLEFCNKIPELCPAVDEEKREENIQGVVECAICELAVLGVDRVIKTNNSASAINSTLENFCNSLPTELSEPCQKIEPEILKAATDGINPKTACKVIKLCLGDNDGSNKIIPCDVCHTAIDAMGIRDTGSICKHLESCIGETEQKTILEPSVKDDAGCEICQLVVTFLDQLVEDNKTMAAVNATLYEICKEVPDQIKTVCLGLIPSIESILKNGLDPKEACKATSFCPNDTVSSACDFCTFVANNNKDGKLDEEILDTTCTRLCHTAERRSAVSTFVQAEDNVQKPCDDSSLGCIDAGCEACKLLLNGINVVLGNNVTVEAVNKTMSDICNKMAGESTVQACLRTVPKVVEILQSGLSPDEACKVVGLCKSDDIVGLTSKRTKTKTSLKKVLHTAKSDSEEVDDDLKCTLCQGLGEAFNTLIENDVTEAAINNTLNNICANLPSTALQDLCFGAAPKLLQAMKDGLNITDVCVKLELCTAEVEHVVPVRQKRSVSDQSLVQVDFKCDVCEFLIGEADKVLAENATKVTINTTVYGLCNNLQGTFQAICVSLAPQVVDTVEKGADPKTGCTTLGVCNKTDISLVSFQNAVTAAWKVTGDLQNSYRWSTVQLIEVPKIPKIPKIPKKKVQGDLKCDVCKYVVTEVDKRIGQNSTVEKINSTVYEICNKQTSVSIKLLCLAAAPEIVKELANGGDPSKVCEDIKLCTKAGKIQGDLPCDVCKYIITEAEKRLSLNSTIQKINETMNDICGDLFGNLKKLCIAATPQIVQALQTTDDPNAVCDKVGYCDQLDNAEDLKIRNLDSKPGQNLKDLECDICEGVIDLADSYLGSNSSAEKINSTVYDLCNRFPGTLQAACLGLAPRICNALESGLDPEKACDAIKLCKTKDVKLTLKSQPKGNLKDVQCDICKEVIQTADNFLESNASAQKINSTVYALCNSLPQGTLQNECLMIAPQIVQTLEGGLNATEACDAIGLCNDKKDINLSLKIQPDDNLKGIECDLCEEVVKILDTYLEANASEEKINATLYDFCKELPGTFQTLCIGFIPQILDVVASGLDPQQACEAIKLCDSKDINLSLKIQPDTNLKGIECDLCEEVVKILDTYLEANASEEKINATLYDFCKELPGTFQTLCIGFIPQILDVVASGLDPKQACEAIKLCDSKDSVMDFNLKRKDNIDCDACKVTLQHVYNIIERDYVIIYLQCNPFLDNPQFLAHLSYSDKPKVQRVLGHLCERLPATYNSMCMMLVSDDESTIFKAFLKNYTPVLMCEMAQCIEGGGVPDTSNLS